MSECVVRMEMPEGCFCCPIQGFNSHGVSVCGISRTSVDRIIGKPDWCPIICSLPEGHGRLVDEKEVKDWVENWLCVNKYYHPYSSTKSIPVSELYDVFQRMDASVPAERSET